MKNQDGGLKVPLFDLRPSKCHVRCQNFIGSYASTHSTFNLIGPCNRRPNTQGHKATKIHTFKPLTYELFFQNSSIRVRVRVIITVIVIVLLLLLLLLLLIIIIIIIIVVAESSKRSGSVEKDKVEEIPAN